MSYKKRILFNLSTSIILFILVIGFLSFISNKIDKTSNYFINEENLTTAFSFQKYQSTSFENNSSPYLEISYSNLAYSSEIYLVYAVKCDNFNPNINSFKMLFWNNYQLDNYYLGTEDYAVECKGYTGIDGQIYYVFYSQGLAAKQLTDTIYCRAYVDIEDNIIYSNIIRNSGVQYLNKILKSDSVTEEDKNLAKALLQYGASAQIKFNYNLDYLATDNYCSLSIENGNFIDGLHTGYFKTGTKVKIISDLIEDEYSQIEWAYLDGEILGYGKEVEVEIIKDGFIIARYVPYLSYEDYEGLTFTENDSYCIPYIFFNDELTIQASIILPPSYDDRGGVIVGNYGLTKDVFNFEIYYNGMPRIYFIVGGKTYDYIFQTDIRNDTITNIAIKLQSKGVCDLFVNGVYAESIVISCNIPKLYDSLKLGGDLRSGNFQYFKGVIYDLNIYSDFLSNDIILNNYKYGSNLELEDLALAYKFITKTSFNDYSKNNKDIVSVINGFSLNDKSERFSLTNTFDTHPLTFEAYIDIDADVSNNKGCTIIGNYLDTYLPGITFRVYLDGRPQLCLRYDRNHQDQYTLPQSVLGIGKVHIAFSIDDIYVYGYLNGDLALKKAHCGYLPNLHDIPFSIGGDIREDNSWWFRDGSIYTINLFGAYRNQEQIRKDINYVNLNDEDLMIAYDFTKSNKDLSFRHNDIYEYYFEGDFISSDSYDYTFAIIGDTQAMTKLYPDLTDDMYRFIIDNKDKLKIERVIGLGDITNDCTDEQWQVAYEAISLIDGVIPYSLVRGNHDVFTPEEHKKATSGEEAIQSSKFNDYFDNEKYRLQYTGSYNNNPTNTFYLTEIYGIKYLFINLDFSPSNEVLNWAGDLCKAYSDYNVVVSMHCFLFRDKTTLDDTDVYPPTKYGFENDGDDIWNKFISKYPNIVLVISGHDPSNNIVYNQFVGENGNIVTCVLVDQQYIDSYIGASGMVTLFHFSSQGSILTIECFSTVHNKFYKLNNQFTIRNVNSIK